MEENKIIEVIIEDEIAKLKTTLECMGKMGATVPQVVKDTVIQEIAVLEAKALEEAEKVKAETISFYDKHKTEIIIVSALLVLHVAGLFGM